MIKTLYSMLETDKKTIKREILSKTSLAISIFLFLMMVIILIASLDIGFGLLFLLLSLFSLVFAALIYYLITRKLWLDLKFERINLTAKILINKEYRIDYEPGSTTMPVTILSFLTPKIFNREMKPVDVYKAWTDDEEYLITKEEFEQITVNKEIQIRRGFYSNLYLGIEDK